MARSTDAVIHYLPASHAAHASGSWTELTAGGCPAHSTWPRNPQFELWPSVATGIYTITVRLTPNGSDAPAIGVWVMPPSDDGQRRRQQLDRNTPTSRSRFARRWQHHHTVSLERRAGKPHLIVASTFEPGYLGDFELTVASPDDVGLRLIPIDGEEETEDWELDDQPRPDTNAASEELDDQPRLAKTAVSKVKAGCLGILRLDYDYPPAPGDIDSPLSYDYKVIYRVVPGLTFQMCQLNALTPEVEHQLILAVEWLTARGVSGITGDCGFMMYLQERLRQHELTHVPVFMSALAQLPAVCCGYSAHEHIAIFTANSETLAPMKELISDECGVDVQTERFIIVGCEDVPGFEAVARGEKVDVAFVTPGMVAKARQVVQEHPEVRAILMECTEMPPYSDALRQATGLPVFDAITCCNFFMSGVQDNPRFGLNEWQECFDGQQERYEFGQNLSDAQKRLLVNKCRSMPSLSLGPQAQVAS